MPPHEKKEQKRRLAISNPSIPTNNISMSTFDPIEFTKEERLRIASSLMNSQVIDEARTLGNNIYSYEDTVKAGRIFVKENMKITGTSLKNFLINAKDILHPEVSKYIEKHIDILQQHIDKRYEDNFNFTWFSVNSFYSKYVWDVDGIPIEFPQIVYMRCAIQMFYKPVTDSENDSIEKVLEYYNIFSDRKIVPSTPTFINACKLKYPQMISCFLVDMGDNMESIRESSDMIIEILSKDGGVSANYNHLRTSKIRGGKDSCGPIPFMVKDNYSVSCIHRGAGRRGAETAYLRDYHHHLIEFIECTDPSKMRQVCCPDIFTSVWTSYLFWKRVRRNEGWTLFCPKLSCELEELSGAEFEKRYLEYENSDSIPSNYRKTVKARDIMNLICRIILTTGHMFVAFGDACNAKSNQKNLGYIKQSNLCTEIIEYTDPDTPASCNICNINLEEYIITRDGKSEFDFISLQHHVKKAIPYLNRMMEVNHYPRDKYDKDGNLVRGIIYETNMRNRPCALGVMGLADTFMRLRLPFDSKEAAELNKKIAACIYFNAIIASIEEATKIGTYETYKGSPISEGKFQFDLWAEEAAIRGIKRDDSPLDPGLFFQQVNFITEKDGNIHIIYPTWDSLREKVIELGVANSLLISHPPTASTAEITNSFDNTEPIQYNIGTKRNQDMDYLHLNKHLYRDLSRLNLLNREVINFIVNQKGRITGLSDFLLKRGEKIEGVKELEALYKTAWEIDPKVMIDYNVARGRYVCQSQSLNLYISRPRNVDPKKINHAYMNLMAKNTLYAEKKGVKTIYYINTEPIGKHEEDINITPSVERAFSELACSINNPGCESCKS